jgi:hypothetical protein
MLKLLFKIFLFVFFSSAFAQEKFPNPISFTRDVAWFNTPDVVMDIKWLPTTGFSYVQDGVCYLVFPDDPQGHLLGQREFDRCVSAGAKKTIDSPPVPGAERVHVFYAQDHHDLARMLREAVVGQEDAIGTETVSHCNTGINCTGVRGGHYIKKEDHSKLLINKQQLSLGHEVKHVFKGLFHGGWAASTGSIGRKMPRMSLKP